MKSFLAIILTTSLMTLQAQDQSHEQEVELFQNELNEEFQNPEESPLTPEELKKFKNHKFFPINKSLRIEAKFVKNTKPATFQMKTSTERAPTYDIYGKAIFKINGKKYKLNIYQSHRLREKEEYKNHLFLPFTDMTNGFETYGGGRYIDLTITDGDVIIIDFNKAYNPYCAYSHKYSCPIPPRENDLSVRIEAGVMTLEL